MLNKVLTTSKYLGIDANDLDEAAIVRMVRPGTCRTFEEHSQQMVLPYITPQLETVSIVDIVWDMFLTYRLKQSMIAGAPIPANWEAFLRSNGKKDYLFRHLPDCIHACETGTKVIIST